MMIPDILFLLLLGAGGRFQFAYCAGTSERFYRIVTIEEPPFMRNSENGTYGYLQDMLDVLKKRIGFNYTVYFVADGKYGIKQSDGTWSGLVWDLINQKADIVLAPFTITRTRSMVIRFSYPFMESSYSMVYKRPNPGDPIPFQSLKDIVNNTNYTFGVHDDSSTKEYFFGQDQKYKLYKEMDEIVKSKGDDFLPKTTREAIFRAKYRNYIHITETAYIRWWESKDCSLLRWSLGSETSRRPYALGFQADDEDTEKLFSEELLKMREDGTLQELEKDLWKSNCPGRDVCGC